jgi:hypothetical protein
MTPLSCAGVPNSSAPQAIGTVERPAPAVLPKPSPGMDPDELLREFLKATADPANRHLAARQFLTESASDAWDDQGSALLIDKVVFVETRSRPGCGDDEGRHPRLASTWVCSRPPRRLPDPAPSNWCRPRRLADQPAAQRGVPGLAAVPGHLQTQHAVLRRPHRQDRRPRPALRGGVRPDQLATELVNKLIAGPRPEMANTVRNLLAPPVSWSGR